MTAIPTARQMTGGMHVCHLDQALVVIAALAHLMPETDESTALMAGKLYGTIDTAIGDDPQWIDPTAPRT